MEWVGPRALAVLHGVGLRLPPAGGVEDRCGACASHLEVLCSPALPAAEEEPVLARGQASVLSEMEGHSAGKGWASLGMGSVKGVRQTVPA